MDAKNQAKQLKNISLLQSLKKGFDASKLPLSTYVNSNDWKRRVNSTQHNLNNFIDDYDYIYDLFLIDKNGTVIVILE